MMTLRTIDDVVAVGVGDTVVLEANPHRRHIILGNAGTAALYVRLGQKAAVNSGMPLPVGAIPIEVDAETIGNGVGLTVHCIASAAGGAIAIWCSQD